MIKNIDNANYRIACVVCGEMLCHHQMVAHRNKQGAICGWVFVCERDECVKKVFGNYITVLPAKQPSSP
jgi:hypothetical protein